MTPDELARLLASGLTPDEVGRLYDRSGSMVRLVARRWGLDCRRLRARSLGLAVTHPEVAAQFVDVVDGAPSGSRPVDLTAGSGARCRWRCPDCSGEWVTSVANRTTRRSGCPACARQRGRLLARARTARTPALSAARPDAAAEFVTNISRPDRDASTTPSGSHDRVRWRCSRGHHWEASTRQRVKYATQCPTCLAGLWTSRLEFEVAELVSVATGSAVTVGARLPRADRASDELVDLLIDDVDLLVDLDPPRWHSGPVAITRDAKKLERLAGRPYVRIRPAALGRLPTTRATEAQQVLFDGPVDQPDTWATAVVRTLTGSRSLTLADELPESARVAALIRADARWRVLRAGHPRRSLASEHPDISSQFVRTISRPGATPTDLAPAGDDRVLWQCPDCGHLWEARVANRTALGTGCPPCSSRRGAIRAAMPRAGRSFADAHPELIAYFVSDQTNPGQSLTDLKPNSTDRCTWTCRYCGGLWVATPHDVHRRPARGCRPCGHRRGAEKRRAPRPETTP
ncbi:zinc-ribbon domain-containing protein [Modestobacter sp. VKM Ac-2983]|uniref:zinc-ribbon domain-containing protein n=1 Tax=Modestobacter sp. VKM Ac-2983 TaxID=3004137 RepID=UPI0022AB7630|nr:zinc-ribbon domain-containing protein [Modestobacter sp. VKM Ac-2983]MCZ2804263.1 zinc-ribbon domain-containing protein [Modestobacter sp. VKM Ac-2983]